MKSCLEIFSAPLPLVVTSKDQNDTVLNLKLTVIFGYQIFFPVGREEETVAYSYLDIIPSTTYQLCSWFKSFNSQGPFSISAQMSTNWALI